MSDKPVPFVMALEGYANWLGKLRNRIHNAQQRPVLAVNRELVQLYWQIGCDILQRQAEHGWGRVFERLVHDLRAASPQMRDFSRANLLYMRSDIEQVEREQGGRA